jgi:hypothetical protein
MNSRTDEQVDESQNKANAEGKGTQPFEVNKRSSVQRTSLHYSLFLVLLFEI